MERCVGKFRPVPRGGVKEKNKRKNRSRTDRAVCREISPCATRWRENKNSVGDRLCEQVLDFVLFRFDPRGGLRMEGDRKKRRKKNLPTLTIYVDLVVKGKKSNWAMRWLCLTCRGNFCEDSV